jgi:hypothetical protein
VAAAGLLRLSLYHFVIGSEDSTLVEFMRGKPEAMDVQFGIDTSSAYDKVKLGRSDITILFRGESPQGSFSNAQGYVSPFWADASGTQAGDSGAGG